MCMSWLYLSLLLGNRGLGMGVKILERRWCRVEDLAFWVCTFLLIKRNKRFISYLKELERERDWDGKVLWQLMYRFTPQKAPVARAGPFWSQEPGSSSRSPVCMRGPQTWTILQATGRELDHKWSIWDLNCHWDEMSVLEVAAWPAMPQWRWPFSCIWIAIKFIEPFFDSHSVHRALCHYLTEFSGSLKRKGALIDSWEKVVWKDFKCPSSATW